MRKAMDEPMRFTVMTPLEENLYGRRVKRGREYAAPACRQTRMEAQHR
jgi:hypothetical protein